jgi:hypothetical protein
MCLQVPMATFLVLLIELHALACWPFGISIMMLIFCQVSAAKNLSDQLMLQAQGTRVISTLLRTENVFFYRQ